jgi:hypothetical protein
MKFLKQIFRSEVNTYLSLRASFPLVSFLFVGLCLFYYHPMMGQAKVNYNEAEIRPYTLPEVLVLENGEAVNSLKLWEKHRRPEIVQLFKDEVYGKLPKKKLKPSSVELIEQSASALDGKAIRKQFAIHYTKKGKELTIHILLYLPNDVESPPVFLGYNFFGNHTIIDDEAVVLTKAWVRNNESFGITDNQANEGSRGVRNYRWPIEKIVEEGFGIATVYCGDMDPDRDDFSDGIHPFFYKKKQTLPEETEWGTLSAWAWGATQVLDVLEQQESLQGSKFILFGHSRLGKAALWGGALDQRFDMVISNNSGCGGAALFRRKFGETAAIINQNFPHWFAGNFKEYNHQEERLPVDQHMLIALMAPRPVYIASAIDDQWADPKGEYLSGLFASPVYELYEQEGLSDAEPPRLNTPVHTRIGYHVRTGKHDVTSYDWEQYMMFAKQHFD